ncbi:unnamed protein product [Rotaria socialis]
MYYRDYKRFFSLVLLKLTTFFFTVLERFYLIEKKNLTGDGDELRNENITNKNDNLANNNYLPYAAQQHLKYSTCRCMT